MTEQELRKSLQVLVQAMRPDEQFNNADGDLGAKLNKLLATKGGRAKLRAALESIDDEADEDEDTDEEISTNASSSPLRSPAVLLAPADPKRREQIRGKRLASNEAEVSDAPLGRTPSALLAKNKTEAA